MKSKLLPLSLFTLILGVTSIILTAGFYKVPDLSEKKSDSAMQVAADYFSKIRNNQITHRIDPVDAVKAQAATEALALKSGNALNLNWESMGPDNAPGVVRAILFDNKATSNQSLILAGVTGGIWRTENQGATWKKLNQEKQNLKVSCMVQDSEGTIYAGTGDGFCTNDIQYTQNNIYYSGIVGEGIFKSTDRDNFVQLPATIPDITQQNDTIDFAYIYDLAFDEANSRLYAATNTGLWYSDNKGDAWSKVTRCKSDSTIYGVTIHIDSTRYVDSLYFDEISQEWQYNELLETVSDTTMFETVEEEKVEGEKVFEVLECTAVEVGISGVVMATFDNKVYVSNGESNPLFTNISGNPYNLDMLNMHINYYTTNLTLIDTNNQTYNRGVLNYTDTTKILYQGQPHVWTQVSNPNSPYSLVSNLGVVTPQGRTQIAIAPSDDNVYYAVCSDGIGYMQNMYMSTDQGQNWHIVFPGGSTSTLKPFDGTSCFNMVITVFPNNPYKVLLGGDDLWFGEQLEEEAYFSWGAGPISSGNNPGFFNYVPTSHHNYVFFPGSDSKFAISTNMGISFGSITSNGFSFQQIVRGLSNSQVYTLGISGQRNKFVAGIQSNGLQYVSGIGNTTQTGVDISDPTWSKTGGSCKMSVINPSAFMLSDNNGYMNRTSDFGLSYSLNFTSPTTNLTITPFDKWEDFNFQNSKYMVKFYADKTYYQGDVLLCHSANKGIEGGKGYPFTTILEQDSLVTGDSICVKDVVQSKFFIATHNAVYMTPDILKFDSTITYSASVDIRKNIWQILQTADNYSKPSCLGLSDCANYLFVGTENGRIYRVSNIQDAFDKKSADIKSEFCVIATDEIMPDSMANRYITSISVDPQNPAHILVTLGNYGNESYVFQSMNALEDYPESIIFTDITGPESSGLPRMPVYSSIIEMRNSDIAIIGTELGIFSTQNLMSDNPEWTIDASGIGKAMVISLQQQKTYTAGFILEGPDPTTPPIVYPAVNNYGDIYCATFGRGIFRDATYHHLVGLPEIYSPSTNKTQITLDIYPNPIQDVANISFTLSDNLPVTIQVLDISGRIVSQYQLNNTTIGNNDFSFNCRELQSGVYILSLHAGNNIQNSKFIVK